MNCLIKAPPETIPGKNHSLMNCCAVPLPAAQPATPAQCEAVHSSVSAFKSLPTVSLSVSFPLFLSVPLSRSPVSFFLEQTLCVQVPLISLGGECTVLSCVTVCLSLVCLSVSPSMSVSLSLYISVSLSVSLSLYLLFVRSFFLPCCVRRFHWSFAKHAG